MFDIAFSVGIFGLSSKNKPSKYDWELQAGKRKRKKCNILAKEI
jgi:hypothetical protein